MTHTDRQRNFLDALTAKLRKLDDPDPETITHEGYLWRLHFSARYGRKIPALTFTPYGKDSKIKAEIMRSAGQGDIEGLARKKAEWEKKSGFKVSQDKADYILARRFNRKLDQHFGPIAQALTIIEDPQKRFTKPGQKYADPIRLLMEGKLPAEPDVPEAPDQESRSYADELKEVE